MIDEAAFEQRAREVFQLTTSEVRIYVRIADGLLPDLRRQLKGSGVEHDTDALLVLTRLTREEQAQLVFHLRSGLDAETAVQAASMGLLQKIFKGFW